MNKKYGTIIIECNGRYESVAGWEIIDESGDAGSFEFENYESWMDDYAVVDFIEK